MALALSPEQKEATMDIDTGDHVLHAPSGETWVVAYVRGDRLAWCGWPQGEATLTDCMLLKKAAPEQRIKLLREIAKAGHDPRGQYARDRLEAEGDNEPDPGPGEHPSGEMYAARAA